EDGIRDFHVTGVQTCALPISSRLYNFPSRFAPCRTLDQPHLLYPQFKQVAHPSISTSALVLHLWHMVAEGGKLAPSPVTAMSSWWPAVISPPISPAVLISAFFFERCS